MLPLVLPLEKSMTRVIHLSLSSTDTYDAGNRRPTLGAGSFQKANSAPGTTVPLPVMDEVAKKAEKYGCYYDLDAFLKYDPGHTSLTEMSAS